MLNRKLLEKQRVQNRFASYEVHIGHFFYNINAAVLELVFIFPYFNEIKGICFHFPGFNIHVPVISFTHSPGIPLVLTASEPSPHKTF